MKAKQLFILTVSFLIVSFSAFAAGEKKFSISSADLLSENVIRMKCSGLSDKYGKIVFKITPAMKITDVKRKGPFLELTTKSNFNDVDKYEISFNDPVTKSKGSLEISTSFLQEAKFNKMYSDKRMGYAFENGKSVFRLFVPRGNKVNLVIFDSYYDGIEKAKVIPMVNDGNQVFEYSQDGSLWGKYYGYQIVERNYTPDSLVPSMPHDTIFADPYSVATASNNVYPVKSRTLIYDGSKFDWGDDKPLGIDINEVVIMETHVRDLTAHSTAKTKYPGTFKGMIDAENGGLNYLSKLGVNVMELMPIHDFTNYESPYGIEVAGVKNEYNAYGRNYWGYMTSNFFAPESYYGTDGTIDTKKWNGTDGRVVDELKSMIKESHKKGIAVVLDVVYNHVSAADENPLKLIDYEFYFRKVAKTGCHTELETRRLMARKLILDSTKYWMNEYHVDGFRFDLATSHDKETVKVIYDELRKINPKIYIIAEPWGGDGSSTKIDFKSIGWSYWNDEIRGAIRGPNRPTGKATSFMLGNANNASSLDKFWKGISQGKSYQSVNYIESHDDATLSDNLRITSGTYSYKNADGSINRIKDEKSYLKLSPELLSSYKVATVALFLAQGPIMLHLGQEWARGKITPDLSKRGIKEITDKGEIGSSSDNTIFMTPSQNSYSADNETNYINYDYISLNQELFDYYQGLIKLRKSESLLGNATPDQIKILNNDNKNSLGVIIGDKIIGLVNSDKEKTATYEIPQGVYKVVVDKNKAGTETIKEVSTNTITVEKGGSLILIRK